MISSPVSASLAGSRRKPGAKIVATTGDAITVMRVSNSKVPPSTPATRSTNALTAAWPPCSRVSASTGTKACANAPSANKRRKKLGILKATKNASALPLAPIRLASTTSRNKPSTRDSMVAEPTTAEDLTSFGSWMLSAVVMFVSRSPGDQSPSERHCARSRSAWRANHCNAMSVWPLLISLRSSICITRLRGS